MSAELEAAERLVGDKRPKHYPIPQALDDAKILAHAVLERAKTDWRVGQAATPKLRDHFYFRQLFVVRGCHDDGTVTVEQPDTDGGEPIVINESADAWMTA